MSGLLAGLLLGVGLFLHLVVLLGSGDRTAGAASPVAPAGTVRLTTSSRRAMPPSRRGHWPRRPSSPASWCSSSAYAVVAVPAVALCFALMAGYAPLALVRMRARGRRSRLREVWPDAVDNLASAVRAGMALPEALSQLAHRGPGGAAPGVRRVRRGLPGDRTVPGLPDRLKDRLSRPRRRPARRVAADRARGRRHRPRPAAAHPVDVPARGRPHPRRAGDPTGAGRSTPPGSRWLPRGWSSPCSRPGLSRCRPTAPGSEWLVLAVGARRDRRRLPRSWCGSGGCPRTSGCCDEWRPVAVARRRRRGWCSGSVLLLLWRGAAVASAHRARRTRARPTCGTPRARPACSPRPRAGAGCWRPLPRRSSAISARRVDRLLGGTASVRRRLQRAGRRPTSSGSAPSR